MHSNSRNLGLERERTDLLKRQLSHRSFRKRSEDEYKDFGMWVRRDPGPISGESYGFVSLFGHDKARQLLDDCDSDGKAFGGRWPMVKNIRVLACTLGGKQLKQEEDEVLKT